MKTKRLLMILCVCFLATKLVAQYTIKGRVIDDAQEPVELVNIVLFKTSDSVMVSHAITEIDGRFSMEVNQVGEFYLKASYIGYSSYISKPFSASGNLTLDDIILSEDTKMLGTVTVVGQKRFVEQHADKMVINPEASITTASENILDVLAKSPGIIVDKDGNISIKGKSGVSVLIDNKPTRLSGEQLAAMLRNLQSTSIERIEIIENPPARYDAEGSSGIINLKTKQGAIQGFNGSFSTGAQYSDRLRNSNGLDLNYRNDKWNFYGNIYGGYNKMLSTIDLERRFSDGTLFKETGDNSSSSKFGGAKAGVDYHLNKRHTIGTMVRYSLWKWDSGDNVINTDIYNNNNLFQREKTTSVGDEGGNDINANLNYRWDIDSTDYLNVDIDYVRYKYDTNTDMDTKYEPYRLPYLALTKQDSDTKIYSLKADYENSLTAATKLSAGLKFSKVDISSGSFYWEQDSLGNWNDTRGMTNDYDYQENINAAYLSLSHKLTPDFDIQAGLRAEHTLMKGYNITIDSLNKRNYINLFPTLFLSKKFTDSHQLTASYSYRIGRPNYWLLNPFIWMLNPYTYNQGNPDLQPQFTHSAKLSYTFLQKYIISAGYSTTGEQYTQVFKQDDATKITIVTWENLSKTENMDMTFVIPVEIAKWWRVNTNMTMFYMRYRSPLYGEMLDKSQFSFRGNMNHTFTLPNDWSAELTGMYQSKIVYGVGIFNARGSVDAGIQKQLLNKKLTIKAGVTDIFKTLSNNYSIKYDNVDVIGKQGYDSRRFRINITWRFGNDKLKPSRQRSSGAEEESSRAGK
jgi:Outer membrane receptor proteins, mostly Fe transport